jgi:hypothetical protein
MMKRVIVTRPFQSIGKPGTIHLVDWDDDLLERNVAAGNVIELVIHPPRKSRKSSGPVDVVVTKTDD